MFGKNRQKHRETAAASAAAGEDEEYVREPSGFGKIGGFFKNVKNAKNIVTNTYGFVNDFIRNKDQVMRRLNTIFFCILFGFAVITGLNFILGGMLEKVGLCWDVAVYTVFGLYGLTLVAFFAAEMLYRRNVTVKSTRAYIKTISVFQRIVRLVSLAMSIITFAVTVVAEDLSGADLAMQVIVQILSVIMFILSLFSNISGSIVKFIMWLKSPVNGKRQFRFVATEWYANVLSDAKSTKKIKSVKKVKEERHEGIGRAIDDYLVRYLGKKYITDIRSGDIMTMIEKVPEENRDDVEGTVKQIFAYAVERGMISEDPCAGLKLYGDIEKKKPQKCGEGEKQKFFSSLFGKNKE